jgi:hypothetical protein
MAAQDFLDERGVDKLVAKAATDASAERLPGLEPSAPRSFAAMSPASVLRLQRSVGNSGTSAFLQREHEDEERSPVHSTIAGGGSPLDTTTRSTMEQQLGADFGGVRLHVDAKSAESVQAAAYTVGNDIVVHPDHFSQGTPQAQRTLAHELTHVKQQRSGPVDGTPRAGGIQVSDPSDRFEREAERSAEVVMASTGDTHSHSGGSAAIGGEEEQHAQALGLQRVAEGSTQEDEQEL